MLSNSNKKLECGGHRSDLKVKLLILKVYRNNTFFKNQLNIIATIVVLISLVNSDFEMVYPVAERSEIKIQQTIDGMEYCDGRKELFCEKRASEVMKTPI